VSRLAIIAFNEKGYARDYDACYHDHFFSNHRCPSGLPGENFNKKPNNAKKRAAKGQTDCLKARKKAKLYLRYCHCFVTKISKLQEYQKKSSKLRLNLAWHCTGALIFFDFSWFVNLHSLGKMISRFAYRFIGTFLHESLSHSLLYFMTTIIRVLPVRHNYHISIAKMQTCLQSAEAV